MTDFLSRLADRMLGRVSLIEPVITSPFASPFETVGEILLHDTTGNDLSANSSPAHYQETTESIAAIASFETTTPFQQQRLQPDLIKPDIDPTKTQESITILEKTEHTSEQKDPWERVITSKQVSNLEGANSKETDASPEFSIGKEEVLLSAPNRDYTTTDQNSSITKKEMDLSSSAERDLSFHINDTSQVKRESAILLENRSTEIERASELSRSIEAITPLNTKKINEKTANPETMVVDNVVASIPALTQISSVDQSHFEESISESQSEDLSLADNLTQVTIHTTKLADKKSNPTHVEINHRQQENISIAPGIDSSLRETDNRALNNTVVERSRLAPPDSSHQQLESEFITEPLKIENGEQKKRAEISEKQIATITARQLPATGRTPDLRLDLPLDTLIEKAANQDPITPAYKQAKSMASLNYDEPSFSPAVTRPISTKPAVTRPAGREKEISAQAPPTIKVSIGRIEIRALLPPQPSPQPTIPPAPRLSLDDYLKSGNEGRR